MRPLFLIYDILTVNKCYTTANAWNATVNEFVQAGKLKLSRQKGSVIHDERHSRKSVKFLERSNLIKHLFIERQLFIVRSYHKIGENNHKFYMISFGRQLQFKVTTKDNFMYGSFLV